MRWTAAPGDQHSRLFSGLHRPRPVHRVHPPPPPTHTPFPTVSHEQDIQFSLPCFVCTPFVFNTAWIQGDSASSLGQINLCWEGAAGPCRWPLAATCQHLSPSCDTDRLQPSADAPLGTTAGFSREAPVLERDRLDISCLSLRLTPATHPLSFY